MRHMNQTTVEPCGAALSLRCRGLALRFGRTQALSALDLDLAPGEAVGIVGCNGAGKSTLFRCIIGTEVPDEGTVEWEPRLRREELLERIGYVPDTLSAYDWMTAGEAIDFVASLQPRFDRAWSRELVRLLSIDRAAKIRSLSRGMQARLALTLGLAHRPEVILLDEPLLGVDVVTHDAVLEVLARMRVDVGASMLIASHQLGDLARLTDRVVFMDRGRAVESVPTDELVCGTVRLLVRGVPSEWRPPSSVMHARWQGEAVVLTVRSDPKDLERQIMKMFPESSG